MFISDQCECLDIERVMQPRDPENGGSSTAALPLRWQGSFLLML
jgi:hypothetical protein